MIESIQHVLARLINHSFQAILSLYLSLGIKKATSTVIALPALVLTPVFSFFTFGPHKSGGCCPYKKSEQKICLSFRLSWINAVLTICGISGAAAAIYHLETIRLSDKQLSKIDLNTCAAIKVKDNECLEFLLDIWGNFNYIFYIFGLASICLLLIQFLDRCSCLCCGCFKEHCLPMTEKSVHDTENPLSH